MNALQWQSPLWLLIALVPWALKWWTLRYVGQFRLDTFADAHLLPRLIAGVQQRQLWGTTFLLAWTLSTFAAAGPYWLSDKPNPTQRRAMDIAVVIDISPSMAVQDIAPSRLGRAKQELTDFTRRLQRGRVALITFSANAYTVLPLTTDLDAFNYFAEQLDTNLATLQGSNVAKALDLAHAALEKSDENSRAVILISDGEFHDLGAIAAAKRLRDKQIPLFILGIGTTAGGPVPDDTGRFVRYQGNTVISKANPTMNDSLARSANGLYTPSRDDNSDWDFLFSKLELMHENSAYVINERSHIKLAPWLLAMSLLLFIWSAIKSPAVVFGFVVMLLNFLPPTPVMAAPWNEQKARDALLAEKYEQAKSIYQSLQPSYIATMGLGAISYRQGAWAQAAMLFQQADTLGKTDDEHAQAKYNQGNALAKLERLQDAQLAYRAALSLQPNFPRAALNLSLINKALQLATDTDKNGRSLKEQRAQTGELKNGSQTEALKSEARTSAKQPSDLATLQGIQNTTKPLVGASNDSSDFLRKRFSSDDRSGGQIIVIDKPW